MTGSLYGMAGLGLVLAYRTSGVFNFGHGAVAAGAAFTFYSLYDTHGWPWPPAAVLTIPGAHLHDYAKAPRPGRKVGHVTITAPDAGDLRARVARLVGLPGVDVPA